MSDVPEADRQEQAMAVETPTPDVPVTKDPEAPEADALEQAEVVPDIDDERDRG